MTSSAAIEGTTVVHTTDDQEHPLSVVFGPSAPMQSALELVHQAARSSQHVLIGGEPGTGRRAVARAIHARSGNGDGRFLGIDGGSPGDLETQVFGPARRRRADGLETIGRSSALFQARGGTLCLVKTGGVTRHLSGRLGRVLTDGRVALAEDGAIVSLGLRIIFIVDSPASNGEEQIADEFLPEAELLRIELAPLRRRKQDIPILAAHLLEEACTRSSIPAKSFSGPASTLLAALPWRGNVSELRLFVEALAVSTSDPVVRIENVLDRLRLDTAVINFGSGGTLREARTRFEREFVHAVLDRHRGRVPDAAVALGIQRTNLYRKLRMLRVSTADYAAGKGSGRARSNKPSH